MNKKKYNIDNHIKSDETKGEKFNAVTGSYLLMKAY